MLEASGAAMKRLGAQIDILGWRGRMSRAKEGWAARTRADIAFYEDDNALIRYRMQGTGAALVFMADGPATLELYDDLLRAAAADFRVVVFEPPGNGFSVPKGGYDFTFQAANDGVARFLEMVAGPRSILAFSCGGAYSAIDVAGRHPHLVRALVVIQAPSWAEEMRWKQRRDPTGRLAKPVLSQLLFPRMMVPRAPAWYDLVLGNRQLVPHFCACTAEAFGHGATFALPTLFQSYLTEAPPPLARPRQPTLVVWGDKDGSHAETDKTSSRQLADTVEIEVLDHVGHFPELEAPEDFLDLTRAFLRRHNIVPA